MQREYSDFVPFWIGEATTNPCESLGGCVHGRQWNIPEIAWLLPMCTVEGRIDTP
jgi:hypothetical protein